MIGLSGGDGALGATSPYNIKENCKCKFVLFEYGVWRSLVARTDGVREVASSNLVTPSLSYLKRDYDRKSGT